jgi:hypothetical protein
MCLFGRALLLELLTSVVFAAMLCGWAKTTAQQQGGMATGAAAQAVYDAQRRPITAGGFVKTGPVVFMDVAKQAGLTTWHHTAGTPEKKFILEAKGPGVALLDYDNDGWLDIYLVNGSTYGALSVSSHLPRQLCFTTTTMVLLLTWPLRLALLTTAGVMASWWAILKTTAGLISM